MTPTTVRARSLMITPRPMMSGIAAEAALPETVRQDDDRFEARRRGLVGREVSGRGSARRRASGTDRASPTRQAVARRRIRVVTVKLRPRNPPRSSNDCDCRLNVDEIRIRQVGVVPVLGLQPMGRVQRDDAIAAVAKRQRSQQQRVDQAEHGDVGADADRQRHERRDEKARALAKPPDGL